MNLEQKYFIHPLDQSVINLIKAGEIIERPLNIVKELVENSLDAQSNEIMIEILDGGKHYISVKDNGHGMTPWDLERCIDRHATSKIKTLEDIQGIGTFGFRGEALSSISSVGTVTIKSKHMSSDAHELQVEFGQKKDLKPIAYPIGTHIEVKDLFSQIPVRKKFLKSSSWEFIGILEYIKAISLCYPNVSFSIFHNGRKVFHTPLGQDLKKRFFHVFQVEEKDFIYFEKNEKNIGLSGFLERPDAAIHQKFLTYFVNGRHIKDPFIKNGFLSGYSSFTMKGIKPSGVLFLQIEPYLVDVNVDPSKVKVRFQDSLWVSDFISLTIQEAIRSQNQPIFPKPNLNLSQKPQEVLETIPQKVTLKEDPLQYSELLKDIKPKNIILKEPESVPIHLKQQEILKIDKQTEWLQGEYIGQCFNCFLIFQKNEKLYFIDQHAFHERILFEKYLNHFLNQNSIPTQKTLVPIVFNTQNQWRLDIPSFLKKLHILGFQCSFAKDILEIHSHPTFLDVSLIRETLIKIKNYSEILENPSDENQNSDLNTTTDMSLEPRFFYHLTFATMACHSAIRKGDPIKEHEVKELFQQAQKVDFHKFCPHGRPVMIEVKESQIDTWFKRI